VDAYVLSGIEGIRKSEAALFEIAADRRVRALAKGGWMIGDNLTADMAGGRAVGLRTTGSTGERGRITSTMRITSS
jgi:FMN phosphatase YigB (HAD superfamily)